MDISEMPTQIIGSPGLSNQENSNSQEVDLEAPTQVLHPSDDKEEESVNETDGKQ